MAQLEVEKCVNEVVQNVYGGGVEVLCESSGLPSTGMEVSLLILGGFAMFFVGLYLRRMSSSIT